ncbi:MAG: N-acetyltransferase [Proteobacteria bacterium]|nr:N-acetyltransferase [Pseudomonadota bacterium]
MIKIRPEENQDLSGVRDVNFLAFGQVLEGRIVDLLRDAGALTISLVAEVEGQIIGHIAFSPVTIETNPENLSLLGLGPMAVAPEFQKQGIGAEMISRGLKLCRAGGCQAVVVLGHPGYYPRFGFQPSQPFGIFWENDCPKEAFMILELAEGALESLLGAVKYHPAFSSS